MKLGKPLAALAWLSIVTAACLSGAAAGEPLPQPAGRVILTIAGNISRMNNGDTAEFDLEMLHALGTRALSVTTSWTDGTQEFSGVLMRDLMAAVGAKGTMVEAVALNDYTYVLETKDFSLYPVILATKLNGNILKIRDKGPLWIVYPLDEFAAEQKAKIERRMVWQLKQLTVR